MQKEFAGTIKICELGLLCAVTPKAAKALKGTLKTESKKLETVFKRPHWKQSEVDVRKPYVATISSKRLLWAGWDSYPKVIHNGKEYAKIGDRLYTEHAVSRMLPSSLGRFASATGANTKEGMSMSPNFVEDIIKRGKKTVEVTDVEGKGRIERTIFTLAKAKVVTEQAGQIVITISPYSGK